MNNNNPNLVNQIKQRYLRGNNIKIFLATIFTVIVIVGSLSYMLFAVNVSDTRVENIAMTEVVQESPIHAIPDIPPSYTSSYVIDNAGKLSSETINTIHQEVSKLYKSMGAEIYVVIENGERNESAEKLAEIFFEDQNVTNNGAVIYYSIPYDYTILPGIDIYDGIEREIDNIFNNDVESYFSRGNYDNSVLSMVKALLHFYETNYNYNANVSGGIDVPYYYDYDNSYVVDGEIYDYTYESSAFAGLMLLLPIIFGIILIVVILSGRRNRAHYNHVYYTPHSGFWGGLGLGLFGGSRYRRRYHRPMHFHTPPSHGERSWGSPKNKNNWGSWGNSSGRGSSGGGFSNSNGRGSSGSGFSSSSGRGSSGGGFSRSSSSSSSRGSSGGGFSSSSRSSSSGRGSSGGGFSRKR